MMKRMSVLIGVLLLAMMAGCEKSSQTCDHDSEAIERVEKLKAVYEEYHRAVHAQVLPKIDAGIDHDRVLFEIILIANEKLVPHKDLLMAQAEANLADLPVFTLDDPDQWEEMVAPESDAAFFADEVDLLLDEIIEAVRSEDGGETLSKADIMIGMGFTDPVRAAGYVRGMMMAQMIGREISTAYIPVLSQAPFIPGVADADPANPVIAFEAGPHLILVELARAEEGYYEPVKFEWLVKKGGE